MLSLFLEFQKLYQFNSNLKEKEKKMPKIRPGMPKPPKGFDKISDGLDDFDTKMKEALSESNDGKRKNQLTWGVSRINSQRTRFVYDAFRNKNIENKVVEFCITCGFIDGALIRLWKLPGYESACCVNCVDNRQSTFGGTCACRVPMKDRISGAVSEMGCSRCGCKGCCSADVAAMKEKEKEQEKEDENEKKTEKE